MLDANILKQTILTEFSNVGWDLQKAVFAEALAEAIAKAVVNHIKTYGITTSNGSPAHTHNIT
jgi:hypothetical protein